MNAGTRPHGEVVTLRRREPCPPGQRAVQPRPSHRRRRDRAGAVQSQVQRWADGTRGQRATRAINQTLNTHRARAAIVRPSRADTPSECGAPGAAGRCRVGCPSPGWFRCSRRFPPQSDTGVGTPPEGASPNPLGYQVAGTGRLALALQRIERYPWGYQGRSHRGHRDRLADRRAGPSEAGPGPGRRGHLHDRGARRPEWVWTQAPSRGAARCQARAWNTPQPPRRPRERRRQP
jgi:hypothetical protein